MYDSPEPFVIYPSQAAYPGMVTPIWLNPSQTAQYADEMQIWELFYLPVDFGFCLSSVEICTALPHSIALSDGAEELIFLYCI